MTYVQTVLIYITFYLLALSAIIIQLLSCRFGTLKCNLQVCIKGYYKRISARWVYLQGCANLAWPQGLYSGRNCSSRLNYFDWMNI